MKSLRVIFGLGFMLSAMVSFGQQPLDKTKKYEACVIGFYNVENLFDTIVDTDTTLILQDDFTPHGEKHWNTEKKRKKLANLDEVLSKVATDFAPDGFAVFGVAEVENRSILEELVKQPKIASRNYQIVHHNGPDHRGIDVALMYNPKYFELEASKSIHLIFEGDSTPSSRDQLLVSGKLLGEPIYFVVAHWPSKRGGAKKSDPKRNTAGQLGREIIDSLFAINPKAKIMYMGDLNDDPLSACVKKHLKSAPTPEKAVDGLLYNPMEKLQKQGIGSHSYKGLWSVIDQMLLSPEFTNGDYSSLRYYSSKIYNKEWLINQSGSYKGSPYRTYGGSNFVGGYSDHFPVYTILIRETK
jgi:hypothetical protein